MDKKLVLTRQFYYNGMQKYVLQKEHEKQNGQSKADNPGGKNL